VQKELPIIGKAGKNKRLTSVRRRNLI